MIKKYSIDETTLTDIANAIRNKKNTVNSIMVSSMANEINEIQTKGNMQNKTITPSVNTQTITADSGYDGLGIVTVNAMPTATQATPNISVDISTGLITASATQTAGYVTAGTKTGTKQLTTQAAKTVTPSTSSQTAVSSGVYTTGTITVAAIPSTYIKPSYTKTATTYTPTTVNQSISAGTYCSGAQTIKGDANLKAENIKSGVSIFGVTGTYSNSSSGTVPTTINVMINTYSESTATGLASDGINIQTVTSRQWGGDDVYYRYRISMSVPLNSLIFVNQGRAMTDLNCVVVHETSTYTIVQAKETTPAICCFVSGTQVLTSLDGASTSIELLQEGDEVVSYNTTTGENYVAKVKKLIIKEYTTDIAEVSFANGTILTMNAYHPIYTSNGFHSITNHNGYDTLSVGDLVKTTDDWTEIIDIRRYNASPITTYNLNVIDLDENPDDETNDTFYANGIVVHNGDDDEDSGGGC